MANLHFGVAVSNGRTVLIVSSWVFWQQNRLKRSRQSKTVRQSAAFSKQPKIIENARMSMSDNQ